MYFPCADSNSFVQKYKKTTAIFYTASNIAYLCTMLHDFIAKQIRAQLLFEPTDQQALLLDSLGAFLVSAEREKVFLLKGYAGTGKTSVISALVRALNASKQKTVLLAPTGRAAKVIAGYSGFTALTIHKKIYRQKSMSDFRFQLSDNMHTHTLFIVDEASMISNSGYEAAFGSGRLLDDLVKYVYSGDGCSLLLLGDTAQLPPVMQDFSPALSPDELKGYGLSVHEFTLTHVVRQALESGVLFHATDIREQIDTNNTDHFPVFRLDGFSDIFRLDGTDLIDEIQRSYNTVGMEETIVVTRSNWRANVYNDGIRARVMMREEELNNGDLLMITRNNYFWNKPYKEIDFIANGDIVEVKRIRKYYEMYDFRFVDLTLQSLDYGWEIDAHVWLDSLRSESPAKMNELTNTLFNAVSDDYPEITNKRERTKKVLENEFFCALQVKFAYAVTCHKAQGGQWKHVFIDIGKIEDDQINKEFYRWLYTALTRTSEKVFLVNFPKNAFEK